MKYKADFIQIFPTKHLKHKRKIDSFMKRLSKRCDVNLIWSYGDRSEKHLKGLSTFYICFSNEESKGNELLFYLKQVHVKINKEVTHYLVKLNLK